MDLQFETLVTAIEGRKLRTLHGDWNAERWLGIYAKLEGQTFYKNEVEPGVPILNGSAGAGMTLSFGIAETVV